MVRVGALLAAAIVVGSCGGAPSAISSVTPAATSSAAPMTAAPTSSLTAAPARTPTPTTAPIADVLGRISPDIMWGHLNALTAVGSRDPRHPGHAKAQAYILEQLEAMPGVKVETQRFTYEAIPLINILAIIDPSGGAPPTGNVIVGGHYDSIGKFTPGWRPAVDPAPGADDNGTGTAALLEYARVIASDRAGLTKRVVIAFWDGEEFFFKGAAAFVQALQKPYAYAAFVNLDMVGYNPVADRLDLFWYGSESDKLRDAATSANATYKIGVSPLRPVFADDPNKVIMDSAPFGLSGIPAITICEGYLDADSSYPGNPYFHTVNDTTANVNRGLWLKATKLALAVAMELARAR